MKIAVYFKDNGKNDPDRENSENFWDWNLHTHKGLKIQYETNCPPAEDKIAGIDAVIIRDHRYGARVIGEIESVEEAVGLNYSHIIFLKNIHWLDAEEAKELNFPSGQNFRYYHSDALCDKRNLSRGKELMIKAILAGL